MKYPGYLLNPGDLFQVDPERVMYATGASKDAKERRSGRIRRRVGREAKEEAENQKEDAEAEQKAEEAEAAKAEAEVEEQDPRETLKQLLSQAKGIMSANKNTIPAKRRQDVRAFQRAVKRVLSRSTSSTVLTDNLEAQFLELKAILSKDIRPAAPNTDTPNPQSPSEQTPSSSSSTSSSPSPAEMDNLTKAFQDATLNPSEPLDISALDDAELEVLKKALSQLRDNPIDSTKPYSTPWRPRDYMSAFAFIPRYLEVNQNVCAAVYLRHPVARPGMSEVPTPFSEAVGGGAFAWYLRRR